MSTATKNKKPDSLLREYASNLSDDNLNYLNSRLTQRLQGDIVDALDVFHKTNDNICRWLSSALS